MKKIKVIPLLALTPFLLTACSQKISSDQFANELANVKTSLDNRDTIVDVHINNKLSVNSYDYKVGEFYSYSFLVSSATSNLTKFHFFTLGHSG